MGRGCVRCERENRTSGNICARCKTALTPVGMGMTALGALLGYACAYATVSLWGQGAIVGVTAVFTGVGALWAGAGAWLVWRLWTT